MKRIRLFFLTLLSISSLAKAQIYVGNGGDAFAAEFIGTGRDTVQYLSWINLTDLNEFNTLAFAQAIETVSVSSQPRVVVANVEVGAANFPAQKKIVVSQSFWPKYNQDQRMALVLHEYIGVMGLNDTNYRLSGIIYQRIMQATTTPSGRPMPVTLQELVGGYLFDSNIPNSQTLATQNYQKECADWTTRAKSSLSTNLGAINCGAPYKAGNRLEWGYQGKGQLTFFTKYRPTIVRQPIVGEAFEISKIGIQASLQAIDSHQKACGAWLKDVKQTAGKHFLYASCGGVNEHSWLDVYQFYSSGIIVLIAPDRGLVQRLRPVRR